MNGPSFVEIVANGPCHTTPPQRLADLYHELSGKTLDPYAEACSMLRSPNWPGYPAATVRFAGALAQDSANAHVFDVRTNDRQVIRRLDQVLDSHRSRPVYQQALTAARDDVNYAVSDQARTAISQRLTPAQSHALRCAVRSSTLGGIPASPTWATLARHGLVVRDRSGRVDLTSPGRALATALERRALVAELRASRREFVELVAIARRHGWRTQETDRRAVDGIAAVTLHRHDDQLTIAYVPDPISGHWNFAWARPGEPAGNSKRITRRTQVVSIITAANEIPAAPGPLRPAKRDAV